MQENTYNDAINAIPFGEDKKSLLSGLHLLIGLGPFPVCSLCERGCHVKMGNDGSILLGNVYNEATPLVCNACHAIICQHCAGDTTLTNADCAKCGINAGMSVLLPSVRCDICNDSYGLVVDNHTPGKVIYQNIRGMPLGKCHDCNTIYCVKCALKAIEHAQTKTCPKCGGINIGLYIPGYDDTDVLVVDISEAGRIIVASEKTEVGKKAKEKLEHLPDTKITDAEQAEIDSLIKKLEAPGYRFWVDREGTLKRLIELGPKAEAAIDSVLVYLSRPNYFEQAMQFLLVLGPRVKRILPDLIRILKSGSGNERASAALAIGFMSPTLTGDAIPYLVQIYESERDERNTGPRCAAAIALFKLNRVDSNTVTRIVADHVNNLEINGSMIPTYSFLETVVRF